MSALSSTLDRRAAGASPARLGQRARENTQRFLLAAAAASSWFLVAAITLIFPDKGDWGRGPEFAYGAIGLGGLVLLAALVAPWFKAVAARLRKASPWLIALGFVFSLWQVLTAKAGVLPLPFFPPPHALLEVFTDDYPKLVESINASSRLLGLGIFFGVTAGFVSGVALGWSKAIGYWVHPVLRLIGPLPATAWLPIAFFAFPSSWSASIFLIALAVWFPVTVLTWSGVASVDTAYYDVARTLGANQRFLILKVAIPAALPHVFVGLFMGLGASFAVLIVAEMMGVKAGLGFYLQWAQGWAAYANMYAALLVMSLACSGLITLLFKLRDHVLSYQKGDLKW